MAKFRQPAALLLIIPPLLLLAGYCLLPWVAGLPAVQARLKAAFERTMGPALRCGSLAFIAWPFPEVHLRRLELSAPAPLHGTIAEAVLVPTLSAPWRLHLAEVRIAQPELRLAVEFPLIQPPDPLSGPPAKPGADLLENLLRRAGQEHAIDRITVRDGALRLVDPREGELLHLTGVAARLDRSGAGLHLSLACRSDLWRALDLDASLEPGGAKAHLMLARLEPQPLWKRLFPDSLLAPGEGAVDLTASFRGITGGARGGSYRLSFPALELRRGDRRTALRDGLLEGGWQWEPQRFSMHVETLRLQAPRLLLDGRLESDGPRRLKIQGHDLDLDAIRQAALELAGGQPVVEGVFDVLRGGHVPWITLQGEGTDWESLLAGPGVRLQGEISGGTVHVPAGALLCQEVAGGVTVTGWRLIEGRALSARLGASRGRAGELSLDLGPEPSPWQLAIEVDARLDELPPILERLVEQADFRRELALLRHLQGEAAGRLLLDRSGEALRTRVALERFDLTARHDRIPLPLALKGGGLIYDTGGLALERADGRLGAGIFKGLGGRLDWDGEPRVTARVDSAEIDLGELFHWLAAGRPEGEALPLSALTGRMELTATSVEGRLPAPEHWQGEGRLTEVRLRSGLLPDGAAIPAGRLRFAPQRLELAELVLESMESRLNLSGELHGSPARLQRVDLRMEGALSQGAIHRLWPLLSLPPMLRPHGPLGLHPLQVAWQRDGPLAIQGALQAGEEGQTALSGMLQRTSDGSLQGRGLRLVQGAERLEVEFTLQGETLQARWDGALEAAALSRLLPALPESAGHLSGRFEFLLPLGDPLRFAARGALAGEGLRLAGEGWRQATAERIRLEARDGEFQVKEAALSWPAGRVLLAGRVALAAGPRLHFDLDADAETLDLESMAALWRGSGAGGGERRQWPALEGTLRLKAQALTWGGRQVRPLAVHIGVAAEGGVRIDIAEAGACGLSLPGRLTFGGGEVSLALQPTAREAPLDDLGICLGGKVGDIEGRFDLSGDLSGQAPPDGLIAALTGSLTMNAGAGRITRYRELGLLRRLFALLNLTEIFRGRLPDMATEGFAFESLRAEGRIDKGRLLLSEFVIDGQAIDIAASGEIDLLQRTLELAVLAAPLKTANFIVRHLPLVNQILAGTLVSVPVRVFGPLADPQMTPLSPTLVGKGLIDIMIRTLKLPVSVVQPLLSDPTQR